MSSLSFTSPQNPLVQTAVKLRTHPPGAQRPRVQLHPLHLPALRQHLPALGGRDPTTRLQRNLQRAKVSIRTSHVF